MKLWWLTRRGREARFYDRVEQYVAQHFDLHQTMRYGEYVIQANNAGMAHMSRLGWLAECESELAEARTDAERSATE